MNPKLEATTVKWASTNSTPRFAQAKTLQSHPGKSQPEQPQNS